MKLKTHFFHERKYNLLYTLDLFNLTENNVKYLQKKCSYITVIQDKIWKFSALTDIYDAVTQVAKFLKNTLYKHV